MEPGMYWLAVQGLEVRYYNKETLLLTIYLYCGTLNPRPETLNPSSYIPYFIPLFWYLQPLTLNPVYPYHGILI